MAPDALQQAPKKLLTLLLAFVTALGLVGGFTRTARAADATYVLTDTIGEGGEYLIVSAQDAGSAYAVKNAGVTTTIARTDYMETVSIQSGQPNYIETSATDIVWKATGNGDGFILTNSDVHLEGGDGGIGVYDSETNVAKYWVYDRTGDSSEDDSEDGLTYWDKTGEYTTLWTLRFGGTESGFSNYGSAYSDPVYLFVKEGSVVNVPVEQVTMSQEEAVVRPGYSLHLTATVLPKNATNKELTWASSDPAIASVDENGVVQALAVGGPVEITVTAEGKSATCKVTVSEDLPLITTKWKRLAGNGRYETMAAIVSEGFTQSDWAVIATGDSFPDALVAAPLAGALNAPIILTESKSLSTQAKDQLTNLGVKNVFIMGGKSAVSEGVEKELKAMGITIGRVEGNSRQATSIAALNRLDKLGKLDPQYQGVVIATGKNFADALSIGPLCYRFGTPILLTNNDGTLTDDQVKACKRLNIDSALIVGGTGVVSDKVIAQLGLPEGNVSRVAGKDRYDTSDKIARYEQLLGFTLKHVGIATGKSFPDALAGAALCGKGRSLLLLVEDEKSPTLNRFGADSIIETGYVLGGKGAVSADLYDFIVSKTL